MIVAIGPSSFADEDTTPLAMLEAAGVTVKPNPYKRRLTEAEIITQLEGVDGLIAGLEPLNRNVMSTCAPRLKAIARVGIGVENVDFDAAREFNVKVSSTPDGPVNAVAEMVLTALLAICRRLVSTNEALHRGEWKKTIGTGLWGAKVLLIGYGRIGRRTGDLLRAFGAEILVHDPFLEPHTLQHGERVVELGEGLAEAEVISLHASGDECILGRIQFSQMRKGMILLNSARGSLVSESGLISALESGIVHAAWIDAFWREPYTGPLKNYPLTVFQQALLTPHISTYTIQCRREMETAAVRNLLRDLGV